MSAIATGAGTGNAWHIQNKSQNGEIQSESFSSKNPCGFNLWCRDMNQGSGGHFGFPNKPDCPSRECRWLSPSIDLCLALAIAIVSRRKQKYFFTFPTFCSPGPLFWPLQDMEATQQARQRHSGSPGANLMTRGRSCHASHDERNCDGLPTGLSSCFQWAWLWPPAALSLPWPLADNPEKNLAGDWQGQLLCI